VIAGKKVDNRLRRVAVNRKIVSKHRSVRLRQLIISLYGAHKAYLDNVNHYRPVKTLISASAAINHLIARSP